jgi:D-alanyl-D-alanine carboxypeptidase
MIKIMNWRSLLLGKIILITVFLGAWFWLADAAKVEYESVVKPSLTIVSDVPPVLSADSFIVLDLETGQTITSKEPDKVLPIASITKLFTAEAVLKSFVLDEEVVVSPYDVWSPEPFGKLQIGEKYSHRELLFPLLLESSNDAAALYERVSDKEVIKEMGKVASDVGLIKTKFSDASGLSLENVSTVSEIASYLTYLNKEQSHILDITRLPQYVGPYTGWLNNSPVFAKDYMGGKHGYTTEAGRTIGAIFSLSIGEAKRSFVVVILGSKDIVSDTNTLKAFVSKNVRFE